MYLPTSGNGHQTFSNGLEGELIFKQGSNHRILDNKILMINLILKFNRKLGMKIIIYCLKMNHIIRFEQATIQKRWLWFNCGQNGKIAFYPRICFVLITQAAFWCATLVKRMRHKKSVKE